LSLATIVCGTAAGTHKAYQLVTSKPGTPDSAMVGTSGNCATRRAEVTPSARILPLLMYGVDAGTLSNKAAIWPPIKSVSAGAPPLYGMCSSITPVIDLNSSAERCPVEPTPGVP